METNELKKKARSMDPVVRIGKNGINEGTIEEIKKLLKRRRLIKIKMLRSFAETEKRRDVADMIAKQTSSRLVEVMGNSITLYK